jgi:hypothetical protein
VEDATVSLRGARPAAAAATLRPAAPAGFVAVDGEGLPDVMPTWRGDP